MSSRNSRSNDPTDATGAGTEGCKAGGERLSNQQSHRTPGYACVAPQESQLLKDLAAAVEAAQDALNHPFAHHPSSSAFGFSVLFERADRIDKRVAETQQLCDDCAAEGIVIATLLQNVTFQHGDACLHARQKRLEDAMCPARS